MILSNVREENPSHLKTYDLDISKASFPMM